MQQAQCQNCRQAFTIEDEDLVFYTNSGVPPPTFCPACRFQRRCAHINVRSLYPRVLAPGQKPMISMYSQDKEYNVVEDKDWWSDKYDFFSFGAAYDFKQPFFTQFDGLFRRVPLPHLQRNYSTFENSEYCNAASGLRNCYLTINADNDENCLYGTQVEESKYCTDVLLAHRCELCYETVNVNNCYNCMFCEDCENSSNLQWCQDCVGCTDCFGCIGLRHKKHHLFNRQLSAEEYGREIAKRKPSSWSAQNAARAESLAFFATQPRKYMHGRNNESVEGDYIYQSKDVKASFVVEKGEHCKFTHFLRYLTSGTTYAYDYTMFGVGADHIYEAAWCGLGINNVKFSVWNYGSSDLEYCIGCHSSHHLFGCVGLRHQKYCILNTQYTKEEYEKLVPLIKQQMMAIPYIDSKGNAYRYGEFFPIELSPFDYNQTLAQLHCPLTKEQALAESYGWHDPGNRVIPDAVNWKDLPDDSTGVADGNLDRPILCQLYEENPVKALEHQCSQYFKIIPQESAFYRRMGLALPRRCSSCRFWKKQRLLNPFTLHARPCSSCAKQMRTTYAPNRPEPVLCEECYAKHTYV